MAIQFSLFFKNIQGEREQELLQSSAKCNKRLARLSIYQNFWHLSPILDPSSFYSTLKFSLILGIYILLKLTTRPTDDKWLNSYNTKGNISIDIYEKVFGILKMYLKKSKGHGYVYGQWQPFEKKKGIYLMATLQLGCKLSCV